MRLTTAAIFAVGYLVGARAGRERYEQIVEAAQRASRRLEDFSARHPPDRPDGDRKRAGSRA